MIGVDEIILKNKTMNFVSWTKNEFQIDLVTLTLEAIVENMNNNQGNKYIKRG